MLSKTTFLTKSLRRSAGQIRSGSTAMLSWYPHEENIDYQGEFSTEHVQEAMLMMMQKPETATGFISSTEMQSTHSGDVAADEIVPDQSVDYQDGFVSSQIQETMLLMMQKPETVTGFIPSSEMHSSHSNSADMDQMLSSNQASSDVLDEFSTSQIQEITLRMMQKPETATGFIAAAEMYSTETNNAGDEENIATVDEPVSVDQTSSNLLTMLLLSSSPESAIGVHHDAEYLKGEMKDLLSSQYENSLPKTLSEALSDPRPMVVTAASSPFEVVDVNEAWVGLCGYSREEAKQQHLGQMLNGPETDVSTARKMVETLRREHYSRATLTNYTKTGRKFENRVQVGTLTSDDGESIEYFVGLLEEIPREQFM